MERLNQTLDSFEDIEKNWLNSPLTFIHMNIRSLRKNFDILLSQLQPILEKTRLIILTETNIRDEETQFYQIDGYNAIFLNREGRGGGIAIYIQEDIIIYEHVQIIRASFETIIINIKTNDKSSTTTVLSVYRPPSQNINTFINELEQDLSKIASKQDVVVIGDMNIDLHKEGVAITTKIWRC